MLHEADSSEKDGDIYTAPSAHYLAEKVPAVRAAVAQTAELGRLSDPKPGHVKLQLPWWAGGGLAARVKIPSRGARHRRPRLRLARHGESLWNARLRPLCQLHEEPF